MVLLSMKEGKSFVLPSSKERKRSSSLVNMRAVSVAFIVLWLSNMDFESTFCALCYVVESVGFICDLSLLTMLAKEGEGYVEN